MDKILININLVVISSGKVSFQFKPVYNSKFFALICFGSKRQKSKTVGINFRKLFLVGILALSLTCDLQVNTPLISDALRYAGTLSDTFKEFSNHF